MYLKRNRVKELKIFDKSIRQILKKLYQDQNLQYLGHQETTFAPDNDFIGY